MTNPKKIALVIARYSEKISGGAERLASDYAQVLSENYQVEVFTSCARDYITWKNEYEAGSQKDGKILIHRFSVKWERDLQSMNQSLAKVLQKKSPKPSEELDFLLEQGPYCPELVKTLQEKQSEYALGIFVGYLYYPVLFGLQIWKRPAIVVPTFHEEPVLNLPIYAETFHAGWNYAFNAPEERSLYKKKFGKNPKNSALIGTFIQFPTNERRVENSPDRNFSCITVGRMDLSKGFDHFFEYWNFFRKKYPEYRVSGKALGSRHLPKNFPTHGFECLGFLSEEEKSAQLNSAHLLIHPSPLESFSIAIMEAWSYGVPVLVNAHSLVTRGHCVRSQGGLFYADVLDFAEILKYLILHPDKRKILGENGKKYVEANFSRDQIQKKLLRFVNKIIQD